MADWQSFIETLNAARIEFDQLKVVQLAQAILESGRGKSDLFQLHLNPYGMKFRKEMISIADQAIYTDSAGETDIYCKFDNFGDAIEGYWSFIDRPPYSGWRTSISSPEDYIEFIAFAGYIGGPFNGSQSDRDQKDDYIKKVINLFPEARQLLNLAPPVTASSSEQVWKAKGVLLEVGHGPGPRGFEKGASGLGGDDETEYDLNWITAKEASREIQAAGIPCTITDFGGNTFQNDLFEVGQTAAGFDIFCSIHHNSYKNPAQGSEVFVHSTKGDSFDIALANQMSHAIAKELSIRDRNKGNTKRAAWGVLSGAKDTDVRAAVLAEIYFIHVPVDNRKDWSKRGGTALGRSIVSGFQTTGSKTIKSQQSNPWTFLHC